jgi:ankyrin repeat protein
MSFPTINLSVAKGDIEAVRRLVNAGANVNNRSKTYFYNGMTPLMIAAHKGHANVIRYLLSKGANARARQTQNNPRTALIYAVEKGNINSVRALIRHSNLNVQDGNGRSALTTAANLHKPNLVQMLMRAGAKPNAETLEYILNNNNMRNLVGGLVLKRQIAKRAVSRMRTAMVSRRTRAMRGQLGSVRVPTGSTYVNGIPVHIRNMIAAHMRRG